MLWTPPLSPPGLSLLCPSRSPPFLQVFPPAASLKELIEPTPRLGTFKMPERLKSFPLCAVGIDLIIPAPVGRYPGVIAHSLVAGDPWAWTRR